MPLYEYECETCGHRFERLQKFSDPPVAACPQCGGPIHKLIASPAIQFKGSGWYITDYAKKDSAAAGKTPQASEKSAADTSSTAAAEKPASSPDSGSSTAPKSEK